VPGFDEPDTGFLFPGFDKLKALSYIGGKVEGRLQVDAPRN